MNWAVSIGVTSLKCKNLIAEWNFQDGQEKHAADFLTNWHRRWAFPAICLCYFDEEMEKLFHELE